MPEQAQITQLLRNDTLARVERMRIAALRSFSNRSRGEHLRGRGGSSTEFADYRDYQPGDDIRDVDWNIFSRLHRPYLKVYEQEEELHVLLVIDGSSSMDFAGKFARARQLAAAFGVMGLLGGERVSAHLIGGTHACTRPLRGRAGMRDLFAFLEGCAAGGSQMIEDGIDQVLARHRGRGVCVLLSDFLTSADLLRPANALFASGLELFAAQILAPPELDPELNGDIRLVDSETESVLDVSGAGQLLGLYREHLHGYIDRLAQIAKQRQGRHCLLDSAQPLQRQLFDQLLRAGWLT